MFTIVNTALIRGVPFAEADRLLDLSLVGRDGRAAGLSYPDYREWTTAKTLEGIGVSLDGIMNIGESGRAPERVRGAFVSPNLFPLLKSAAILGRTFVDADDRPGSAPVVILGYDVWRGRYGGDPGVIGRFVRVNDIPATIIGSS